ncbi:hypothetical protein ASPVEDRAFT_136428 [Aspergillus versicolor CBS 583.65]|uniref:Cytokinin riboside 5'-monophosphate phosphoribohydrolase n=1 Tax=Aspergillus versicolor CBS 583.65 TaxID=1036611 RepID=A0A1L9PQQ6_ASPVE|nr:uncharacterized protein ASPVEDRAFT_136428 [Aspergillus versicolor CBS 583.65]OJJ03878.1 hypothetical protein ASPVEDRAFT_136428 [Aspergillus versicolor CBS 583.65]
MTQDKPAVVCVFCGSTEGNDPVHLEAAQDLAYEFHKNNVQLVYGGGNTGLMGEIAKKLVSLSGPEAVHGVIPQAMVQAAASHGTDENDDETAGGKAAERVVSKPLDGNHIDELTFGLTTIVQDMHTRKRLMATKVLQGGPGSGFVALAGGFGTIEEIMEMTTWNQLGIHHVGVVLLNVNGYWDGLLAWVRTAVQQGFINSENGSILIEVQGVKDVWPRLVEYRCSSKRYQLNWSQE